MSFIAWIVPGLMAGFVASVWSPNSRHTVQLCQSRVPRHQ